MMVKGLAKIYFLAHNNLSPTIYLDFLLWLIAIHSSVCNNHDHRLLLLSPKSQTKRIKLILSAERMGREDNDVDDEHDGI